MLGYYIVKEPAGNPDSYLQVRCWLNLSQSAEALKLRIRKMMISRLRTSSSMCGACLSRNWPISSPGCTVRVNINTHSGVCLCNNQTLTELNGGANVPFFRSITHKEIY